MTMTPSRERLWALKEKYETLVSLRESREEAIAQGLLSFPPERRAPRRLVMSRLAARFPGALRELDALDAAALRARLDAVHRALTGQAAERWLVVCSLFHEALSEALQLRRGNASSFWDARPALRALVLQPARGRVLDPVWLAVAAELGLTAGEAERLLYPGAPARGVRVGH